MTGLNERIVKKLALKESLQEINQKVDEIHSLQVLILGQISKSRLTENASHLFSIAKGMICRFYKAT